MFTKTGENRCKQFYLWFEYVGLCVCVCVCVCERETERQREARWVHSILPTADLARCVAIAISPYHSHVV